MKFEIIDIKKQFRGKTPLESVSFSVESGTCVGILGKNGSGKSTLLSVLAGVQRCNRGQFLWNEEDLLKNSRLRRQTVGYVPQGTPLFEELTAWDNLLLWYSRRKLEEELKNGVLSMLGIGEFLRVPVRKMSGGMKKRLSIGCSVANSPSLLLLDEPGAALDLVCKESIASYLSVFKKNGGTVILTTHDASELALCDVWYILRNGVVEPYDYDGDLHRLAEELAK